MALVHFRTLVTLRRVRVRVRVRVGVRVRVIKVRKWTTPVLITNRKSYMCF